MLPEQVRKRAELANQLVDQLNEPPGEPAAPQAPAPDGTPAEPSNPSPAPAPAPEPPQAPAPAPTAPPSDDDSWEHKYRTLQGVFAAETGRLQASNRANEDRIRALEQQLAARPPQAPAAPAPAPAAPSQQYTQEEIDRYGPELLTLITSKAADMANSIVTQKMAELAPKLDAVEDRVKAVGQTLYADKQEEFWGELAKEVPDFRAIDASQPWLVWLAQEDDISGLRRQEILDNASNRLDHQRVAKLFKAFKTASGIAPTPSQAPASAPVPPAQPPISPSPRTVGNGGSGTTPREPEVQPVKRSQIAAHYRRSSSDPTYRGTDEYRAMEAHIFQAQAANRVIEG